MESRLLADLGIALMLGLLVGVERERAATGVAGIRTFALITMLGVVSGALAERFGGWILASGILAVLAMLVTSNLVLVRLGRGEPGITTEVAALLMFAVGAVLASGLRLVAIVSAGVVALILHWKQPLHALVGRLGEGDVNAIMRLVLIALVILPILPNRSYGPFGVVNPFQVWLMVVLIVGISLASYVASRLFGARAGTLLSGVLGGLISSTAATVGYARQSRASPKDSSAAAAMILIASTVVFVRVLFEIGVVVPSSLLTLGPPIAAMFVLMVLIAGASYLKATRADIKAERGEPRSDLRAAILFGLLYTAVIVAVAAARERFGTRGLYVVAALSGLTDVDAITLSTAQLVRADRLDTSTGWRAILIGAMANLLFKGLAVAVLAHPRLAARIAVSFVVAMAGGAAVLLFWPG
jgi:uncharacterized membrane protein (DUF4010 family)